MAAGDLPAATAGDREIVATRLFDAPPERVFDLWTDPTHVVRWWGPIGFTTTIDEMDVRPGGTWRFVMHGPDGTDYPNGKVYPEEKEVVRPKRLVMAHVSPPQHEMAVTFEPVGDQTRVTVRMTFETGELRDKVIERFGAVRGLDQKLDRLRENLTAA